MALPEWFVSYSGVAILLTHESNFEISVCLPFNSMQGLCVDRSLLGQKKNSAIHLPQNTHHADQGHQSDSVFRRF